MLRAKSILLSWVIASMAVSFSVAAHDKVVVIPLLGGDEIPTSKVVFVTNKKWTGNLKGPTGADQKCMDESLVSGSKVKGRKFRAWIGGASFPTDFHVGTRSFTRSHLPYKTVTGVTVADDYADLMDGSLNAPINVSQTGSIVSTYAWTGVRTDGFMAFDPTLLCYGFNVSSGGVGGIIGRSSATDWNWTGAKPSGWVRLPCVGTAALYCFEQ